MPKRKYVTRLQSLESFIEPLPTERLIHLAKVALDEVARREETKRLGPEKATSKPEPRVLQAHGRTLR
jgi:hypothetical protein